MPYRAMLDGVEDVKKLQRLIRYLDSGFQPVNGWRMIELEDAKKQHDCFRSPFGRVVGERQLIAEYDEVPAWEWGVESREEERRKANAAEMDLKKRKTEEASAVDAGPVKKARTAEKPQAVEVEESYAAPTDLQEGTEGQASSDSQESTTSASDHGSKTKEDCERL